MKRIISISFYTLLLTSFSNLLAQTHANEIIAKTLSKIYDINKNNRVVEKTFGDIIYISDSAISENHFYKCEFLIGNAYHITAFASDEDVSDINALIFDYDMNNKPQIVARDNITSNDVSFRFEPQENGEHYIIVTATLKPGVKNCFFNLIIDREN